jgi:hypothetical protein
MGPLLWRALADHASDVLPALVRDDIAARRLAASAAALAATGQLIDVLDALERAGVRAMPYKGPVLSLDAYGDIGLRSSDDLDVLIDSVDVDRAWAALGAIGYRVQDGWSWKRWRAANAWQGQCALVAPEGGIPLDLHWRTCDEKLPWNVPLGELWVNAHDLVVAGRTIKAPDAAGQLLLTLLHAARHGWDRLEFLACAAALMRPTADVKRRLAVLTLPGARSALMAGLFATALLFDDRERMASAPAGLWSTPQANRELAAAALRSVRTGDMGANRSARLHLRSLDGYFDRARYFALAALQPTAADYAAKRLPDGLSFAYPLVRLARLATRG